jgi:hypothetical protein
MPNQTLSSIATPDYCKQCGLSKKNSACDPPGGRQDERCR